MSSYKALVGLLTGLRHRSPASPETVSDACRARVLREAASALEEWMRPVTCSPSPEEEGALLTIKKLRSMAESG